MNGAPPAKNGRAGLPRSGPVRERRGVSGSDTRFDAVVRQLQDQILIGQMKPGRRLREHDLSSEFGVSRTPIREAFRRLERDGLVVITSRRGVHVRPISARDAEDLYGVRAHLSGMVARLAAGRLRKSELERLRELVRDIRAAAAHEDIQSFQELYFTFHDLMAHVAGNAWLIRTMHCLTLAIRRYGFISLTLPGIFEHSAQAHSTLVAALARRDADQAERIAREMILRFGTEVSRHLSTVAAYL